MERIFTYTRKQAISDGVLIDVSKMAKDAGMKVPVAITSAVYHEYIEPSEELMKYGQSSSGRLWDTLISLWMSAKGKNSSIIILEVLFLLTLNTQPEKIQLKAVAHSGDEGELVITIMKPEED